MITNFFVFLFLIGLALVIARHLSTQYSKTKLVVYQWLLVYHIVLTLAYYLYAISNPSDSWAYYDKILLDFRGTSWADYYGVSTIFIEFIGYPFIKYLSLPYEGVNMVFSFFGLLGFYFFYIFIKEKIKLNHYFLGVNLVLLILFLPNLHFWSSSFGKGSIIFLGFGLFFFGINDITKRFIYIVIGALIIYHVRPHILFIVLIGVVLGFVFSLKGPNWAIRIAAVLIAVVSFAYIYNDVLQLIGIEEQEVFEESTQLTRRIKGLTRATSGVDITQYSFPMKLFTFLFRPLFVDAPGVLGYIVSFENLFYLLIVLRIFSFRFLAYLIKADYIMKAAFVAFFGVSAALAQISANLGLAMRQKSQVMILLMIVILSYLDEQKITVLKSKLIRKKKREARLRTQQVSLNST